MEQVFLNRLKQCDEEAMAVFIDVYRDRIYRVAYRLTLSKKQALEITERVFVKMLDDSGFVDSGNEIDLHIQRRLLEFTLEYVRSNFPYSIVNEIKAFFFRPKRRVLEHMSREEIRESLLRGLSRLNLKQRQVLILRYFHELQVKNMCEILGMTKSTAKKNLSSGKDKLKRRLIKEIE